MQVHFWKKTSILMAVSLTFINGFGCKPSPTQKASIKVGAILPMTGQLAFLGKPQAAALQIAAENLSREGKLRVEVLVEDSRGETTAAAAAASKLLNVDRVSFAFVTTSAASNAVASLFAEAGTPLFTICSDEGISPRFKNVINFYIGIDDEIETLVAAVKAAGYKSVSFLRVRASVTENAVHLFRSKAGTSIKIINDIAYDLSNLNPRNDIEKLTSDSSDAIVIIGYGSEYPVLLKSFQERATRKPLFGNYTFTSAGARGEGTQLLASVKFTTFPLNTSRLAETHFGQQYTKRVKSPPAPFLDYLFAHEAMIRAIEFIAAGNNAKDIPRLFRGTTFESPIGSITVNADGNTSVGMTIGSYGADGSVIIDSK